MLNDNTTKIKILFDNQTNIKNYFNVYSTFVKMFIHNVSLNFTTIVNVCSTHPCYIEHYCDNNNFNNFNNYIDKCREINTLNSCDIIIPNLLSDDYDITFVLTNGHLSHNIFNNFKKNAIFVLASDNLLPCSDNVSVITPNNDIDLVTKLISDHIINKFINVQDQNCDLAVLKTLVDAVVNNKMVNVEKLVPIYKDNTVMKCALNVITKNNLMADDTLTLKHDPSVIGIAKKNLQEFQITDKNQKLQLRIINNCNNNFSDFFATDNNIKRYVEEQEKCATSEFVNSCEHYNSLITISNWFDELKNGSFFGLLVNIKTNYLSKLGFENRHVTASVLDISNTFISSKDYIDSVMSKSEMLKSTNLNKKPVFEGNGLGETNAIIPLYINKFHWEIVKKQMPIVFGTVLTHNPMGYTSNHFNFMFVFLTNMTAETYSSNNKLFSVSWLKNYLSIFRLCSQLAFEKKYNTGIKKIISEYIIAFKNEEKYDKVSATNIDNLLGQILSCGVNCDSDFFVSILYCAAEHILKDYGDEYLNKLCSVHNNDVIAEINLIFDVYKEGIKPYLRTIISINKMIKTLKVFSDEYGGFKKMLQVIDNNYGYFSENDMEKFAKIISNKKSSSLTISDFFDEFDYLYSDNCLFDIVFKTLFRKCKQMNYDNDIYFSLKYKLQHQLKIDI